MDRRLKSDHIALLIPALDMGGGARVCLYIASGLADLGYRVDLIVLESGGPLDSECPHNVRIVRPARSPGGAVIGRVLSQVLGVHYLGSMVEKIPSLVRYLRRERPDVLAAFAGSSIAMLAASLARVRCRTAISAQVVLSPIIESQNTFRAFAQRNITCWYIRNADRIIAASPGIADDITKLTAVPDERVRVIYNAVVPRGFHEKANEPVEHPWFAPGGEPVVLGVGQLKPQKDFGTLIRAFAHVRQVRRARLLILGEGSERASLERLVDDLRLNDWVDMPGYEQNPYKFMHRAQVLVVSSIYEGGPMVLMEALALGTPAVATDCEAGPAGILDHGRFGKLVPVGDAEAMSSAVLETLDAPPDRERLRERGRDFSLAAILPQYIEALGLQPVCGSGRHFQQSAHHPASPMTK